MEWEERYGECLSLLRSAHEEIRDLQKVKKPTVIRYHCSGDSPYVSGDSLAIQLENSIRHSLVYPDDGRSGFLCFMPSCFSLFIYNEIVHVLHKNVEENL